MKKNENSHINTDIKISNVIVKQNKKEGKNDEE